MSHTVAAPAAPTYDDLIGSLPLETKVALLTGETGFTLMPEPSIELSAVALSDGPTGVRGLLFNGPRRVTLLPNATLLASAWSESGAREVGRILAEEAMAQEIHVVLGPTINLHRSPLGGRLFEAYSEDPLLSGRLAAEYVVGLQSEGVGACLKHLVGNESETERTTVNAVIDEATLREVYLLPFEIAVADADPWSIMSAYNDVNGVGATEHPHVQTTVVKGEWGYAGLIMSDWHATKTVVPAVTSGLDLVMPGPTGPWGEHLVAAVRAGEVAEDVIDEHLQRLLRLADRVGALGSPRSYPAELPAPDSVVRREQMTRLAAAGITVLTNREDTLPLARSSRVALIGRHAMETVTMGGGSAKVNPPHQVSIAEGLTELLGSQVTVTDGVAVRTRPLPARDGFLTLPDSNEPGVEFRLYAADGTLLDTRRAADAVAMVNVDDGLPQDAVRVEFSATIAGDGDSEGYVELGGLGVGSWRVRVGDEPLDFTVEPAGGFGAEVLAPAFGVHRLRLGQHRSLTGEIALRPRSAENPNAGMGMYGIVARAAERPVDRVLADAAEAAADADVAVVVVGLTDDEETESVDKSTLRLPGEQDALVAAVAAAAQRTVVVVNAATPVLMPWLDQVDAVLWAGLPGQEAGHAVAAALLGDLEPSGRLVTTFPAADGASPAWSVTPVDGDLVYGEGRFIGYRGHHAGLAPEPAFWLGHGLGYGAWSYEEPVLVGSEDRELRVRITNVGAHRSREVVQVYWDPEIDGEPVRLVGWSAAELDPGAAAEVTVRPDARMWRRWDTAADAWTTLPETGQLLVARGLGDVRGRVALAH